MPRQEQKIHSVVSRCKAIIWHFDEDQIITAANKDSTNYKSKTYYFINKDGQSGPAENPIIGFEFKKPMDNIGEFKLTMVSETNILTKIRPGDWIAIYMTQGETSGDESSSSTSSTTQAPVNEQPLMAYGENIGTESDLVDPTTTTSSSKKASVPGGWSLRCLGNINRVERAEQLDSEGLKSMRYQIYGYDFGKVFYTSSIFYNKDFGQQLASLSNLMKATGLVPGGQGSGVGSPRVWVETFLRLYLSNFVTGESYNNTDNWHLPDGMVASFFQQWSGDKSTNTGGTP